MSEAQVAGTVSNAAGEPQNTDLQGVAQPGVADGTKPTEGAPATDIDYAFEAPEGVELDTTSVDEFKSIAKELGLSKEGAQKVVAIAVKREQARQDAHAAQVETWGNEIKADPELGKDENLALARKAVDAFGTPELKALLNATGLGNHPVVARLFLAVGKATSEDKLVVGRTGTNPARDAASILYPNQA